MEINDTYKTIANPSEPILLKEKNSKFLGYAFPIKNEEEVKEIIDDLRKQHNGAGHFCYAYQLGVDKFLIERTMMANPTIRQECLFTAKFSRLR